MTDIENIEEITLNFYKKHIYNEEEGYSDILLKELDGDLKYSDERDSHFYWDDTQKLWIEYVKHQTMIGVLNEKMRPVVKMVENDIINRLNDLKKQLEEIDDRKEKEFDKKIKDFIEKIKDEEDKDEKNEIKQKIEEIKKEKKEIKEDRKEQIIKLEEDIKKIEGRGGELSIFNHVKKTLQRTRTYDNVIRFLNKKILDKNIFDLIDCSQKNLLPIMNGKIIDLQTLKVRDRVKSDLFSIECKVNFLGKKFESEHGKKFISSIFNNNDEQTEYFQMLSGYFLTGETDAKLFSIMLGTEGYNGKSKYINIMCRILGKEVFSKPVHKSVIFETRSTTCHDTYECALLKSRFAYFSEASNDFVIKTDIVKKHSGGDASELRNINKSAGSKSKTFNYKLLIATNTLFDFKEQTENSKALMKRLQYIPLLVSFVDDPKKVDNKKEGFFYEQSEPEWADKLETDQSYLDDFFTYICKGAYKWYNQTNDNGTRKYSIDQPKAMINAKDVFMGSIDPYKNFYLNYECDPSNKKLKILRSILCKSAEKYSDENGIEFKKKHFLQDIPNRGFECKQETDNKSDFHGQIMVLGLREKQTKEEEKKIDIKGNKFKEIKNTDEIREPEVKKKKSVKKEESDSEEDEPKKKTTKK